MSATRTKAVSNKTVPSKAVSNDGNDVFIPLNKLKKSPKNARKAPHTDAAIEALAGSIASKGMLQNLVVEPEIDADGAATGLYLVTVGEGRRLAHLLRAKRREIRKTEPVRCTVDVSNDATEISLDENITRSDMHPADQFDAFKYLAEEKGYGAEEIAARFGVTAHVVRQRLRLSAVSPRLIQLYREEDLTLDQLMAFAITSDHQRQEDVLERLSYNREPHTIRRMLTEAHVSARDRRAVFVGAEAYEAAGGVIIRDLFTEDYGGYFEDAALLDRLVKDKLDAVAATIKETEDWKWAQAYLDYPSAHGLRRFYPEQTDLSPEDDAILAVAQEAYNTLSAQYESAEELSDDVDARFGELEAEIERLEAKRLVYAPNVMARCGVFVILNHDGSARIERGFVRPEDEATGDIVSGSAPVDDEHMDGNADHPKSGVSDDDAAIGKPLSDLLIRDLTAHRTLGLRLALSEQPDVALLAVVHALVASAFYQGATPSCLDLRLGTASLASHADGIDDTAAAQELMRQHSHWGAQLPDNPVHLWPFIVGLDADSRMALLAHCAALTVFAVKVGWEKKPLALVHADALAAALNLDMTRYWQPTARGYFGRVTKEHIVTAVREAAGTDAADRIGDLKKDAMAQAAEQLVAATGWLPNLLRAPVQTEPASDPVPEDALVAAE